MDGEPFLAVPNNFGLMLNVDWFQPTLHGSDSIGVIYLVNEPSKRGMLQT